MVIALAGRRIDAPDARPARFPAAQAEPVKQAMREFLQTHQVCGLVCAAACGADMLALEAAAELGLRRRVVLPFARARFRALSVVDRGAEWGPRYDHILQQVAAQGDLIEAAFDPADSQTWFKGNLDILDQAEKLASEMKTEVAALVVWDGVLRGPDDVTGHFKQEAEARGLGVAEILTI